VTSGPSPAGVAELRDAAAALVKPPRKPPKPFRRRRRWLTKRRIALAIAVDLAVGTFAWHYVTATHPAAVAAAVEAAANDAAQDNWAGVYSKLCSSDRAQMSEAELAQGGQAALQQIGGLSHVTVASVDSVSIPVGPLHWPAAHVSGELIPLIGAPSPYSVTAIRSLTGWQVCFSAGGYSSTALQIGVPLDGVPQG
jgi:hypothetical protein